MKLKNKKTGQLGNFIINKDHFECVDLDYVPEYRNLAELNEEWEDYEDEEPEEYWMIDTSCLPMIRQVKDGVGKDVDQEIGNYFETKEEAEQAVEKLKAWKQLKDKGVKIIDYDCYGGTSTKGEFLGEVKVTIDVPQDVDKYLFKLLFGGEE